MEPDVIERIGKSTTRKHAWSGFCGLARLRWSAHQQRLARWARVCSSISKMPGYEGDLYLVNPKRPMIHGTECLGAIEELPEGMDCAVLAIPGAAVLALGACMRGQALRKRDRVFCRIRRGRRRGADAAQSELARIARRHDMVLEGPNCLGMVNYVGRNSADVCGDAAAADDRSPGAAILSQSGALAAVIAVNMRHHGIPLTYSISTGNEAAIGIEDFVEHLHRGCEHARVCAGGGAVPAAEAVSGTGAACARCRESSLCCCIPGEAMRRELRPPLTRARLRATTR